jgi:gliding motility-associated-like protein
VTSDPAKLIVINPKPEFSSIPITEVKEDSTYSYQLSVIDLTNRALVLSAAKKPNWLTFDAQSRRLWGIPTNNDVGEHEVVLRVSNGLFETEQTFMITVMNTNDNPIITTVAPVNAKEDSRYEYLILGDDIDKNDVLNFTAITKPAWLSVDEHTGMLQGTPANEDVGSWTVKLQLSDGHSTTSQQFVILVENVNDPPVFVTDPLLVIDEDSSYGYTVAAEDTDTGDVLHYLILEKPDWINFDTSTRILQGIPTNNDVGVHAVKLQVSDGIVSVEQDFTITVANVNDAPDITSQPIISVNVNDNYLYVLEAKDEDNDQLLYKAEVIPSWLNFDEETGKLIGKTSLPGLYDIVLKVNDGVVEVSQNFSISVIQNPDPVDTISIPLETDPTELLLSSRSFESKTTSTQVIGAFATIDEDHSNHIYQLVDGPGAEGNTFFHIVNNNLYLKERISQAYSNEFSIRVKSTNSFGRFIEEVFILEKYDPERNASAIEIPTTFSPNADGINDTWIIKDLQQYTDVSIEVYDRSGVPLYRSTNAAQGWDGSVSGGKTMEGPFFYIVKVQDIVKKGILIVIK